MLRRLISPKNVTHHEARHLTRPAMMTALALGGFLILVNLHNVNTSETAGLSLFMGILGITYGVYVFFFVGPRPARLQKWKWVSAFIHSVLIGAALVVLPPDLDIIIQIIMILIAAVMVILWDRITTFV